MNKKERKNISIVLAGLYAIVCLSLFWFVFKSTNYYILFGIIISTPLIEGIIYNLLPESNKKVSNKKKPNTKKLKQAPNQLRSDHKI